MRKVFHRYFYALDSDRQIDDITTRCSECASLAHVPREIVEYTTTDNPSYPGSSFACDIMCRARQRILVMRDCFSSCTVARIIPNEQKTTLRDAMIETTAELRIPGGSTIRVDGATAMQALVGDQRLTKLSIEVGRLKNPNKNPVAEKAIQELEYEIKRELPEGGSLSSCQLAVVVARLNSRIRNRGLTYTREMK